MMRLDPARLLSLATLAAFAACSGGGGSAGTGPQSDFFAVKTDPVNGATIYLNDPIAIDFTTDVNLDSASLTTMAFQALDQLGQPVASELVTGSFSIGKRPGDTVEGRRLLFVPSFANDNAFSNGGFRAGRNYIVSLVGGSSATTVLRSTGGKPLGEPFSFRFTTRDGTQPAQLYRNPKSGGPARVGLEVTTATNLNDVPLGLFGAPPLEVRLHFDQALNPADTNVPVNVKIDVLERDESTKGRIFLEYQDPDESPGQFTWIPADVEIERNDLTGATVALRPLGVLPNNAEIRVIAEATLEDIAGESSIANPTFTRVFGVFRTQAAFEQQWNAVIDDFTTLGNIDPLAAFPESTAEVGNGYLKAGFAFEGTPTTRDYAPNTLEIVLNTSFTTIVPATGAPFSVNGGVFNFRNVTIPNGVRVRGTGPNPMVWLCSGRFTVGGELTVEGGNGARVDTLNSANFAKAGGVAGPAGGNGGDGTPSATQRDLRGGNGRGPLQAAAKGGRGGYIACVTGCHVGTYNGDGGGSGGGGGTLATQGDPWYTGATASTGNPNTPHTGSGNAANAFQQMKGFGGAGCMGGSGSRVQYLAGGEPGDRVFVDARGDNNFWGSGIRLDGDAIRIVGEIAVPMGGGGGGGGGDTTEDNIQCTTGNFISDYSGGGGGGGGGVLIVKALDYITILSTGKIIADGGNGGGGEQVGACGEAGGGGGGAGGMVILMSAAGIRIEAHGTGNAAVAPLGRYVYAPTTPTGLYQGLDYNFAISADGGVCTTGAFGGPGVTAKYPGSGQLPMAGTNYDSQPLGALGGLGIIQLMVPPGNNEDGTNTVLDDKIQFFPPNSLSGTTTPPEILGPNGDLKKQLLAWRGFRTSTTIGIGAGFHGVDDFGQPCAIDKNEGDMRPSPTLLPVPFSTKSRARSKWIDTGVTKRRPLTAPDNGARGIVLTGTAEVGPKFEFNGTETTGVPPEDLGYAKYDATASSAVVKYGVPVVPATVLSSATAGASYLGAPAYRLTLASPVLGEANRYAQYEAELLNVAGTQLASFRILSHNASEMLVDATTDLLPSSAVQVRVAAKFFKVITNQSEGLGATRPGVVAGSTPPTNVYVPIANVRIGFAFHNSTFSTVSQTNDPNRFPNEKNKFVYDLQDPLLQDWINNQAPFVNPEGAPRYVMWDVTFDLAYDPPDTVVYDPASLGTSTPRPELHFLRLPFRF